MKKKNLFGKLHKKLLFFFLLVGLTPLIVGGIISYYYTSNILSASIVSKYQTVVEDTAGKLNRFLYERLHELQVLTDNPLILGGLKFPVTLPRVSEFLNSYISNSGNYHLMALLDEKKNLLAFSNDSSQTEDPTEFHLDRLVGDFYQSPLIHKLFPDSKGYTLAFSIPIKYQTEENKVEGYLIAFLKWDEVIQLVSTLKDSQSGSTWILDQQGVFIVHQDPNKILQEKLPDALYEKIKNDLNGHQIEKQELVVYTRVLDYKNLPDLGWMIGASQPLSIALAPVEGLKWGLTGVALIATLGVGLLALFIASRMAKPIVSMTRKVQDFVGSTIQDITTQKGDEISFLAVSINALINYLRDMAIAANSISQGDLNLQIEPRSKKDVLGHAFTQMTQYLKEMAEVADKLANGDLNQNVQPKSDKDVFGKAFSNMITQFRGLASQIRSNADQIAQVSVQILTRSEEDLKTVENISSSAEETSSAMNQMNASVEEVANNTRTLFTATEEISSSIEQMFNSIRQVTHNTDKLSGLAETTATAMNQMVGSVEKISKNTRETQKFYQKTAETAVQGQGSVQKVVESMDKIRQVVAAATETIQNLERKSLEIGSILDVIDTIADQTSLLALNASIIAAQAGEHGRGFAVVAEEIKELANRVGESTREIGQIIKGVQQQSVDAVKVIQEGSRKVDEGVELVGLAGEALDHITGSARSSLEVAMEVVETMQEQRESTQKVMKFVKQVMGEIGEIKVATQEQEKGMSQILGAVEELRGLADQVKRATIEQTRGANQVNVAMEEVKSLILQSTGNARKSAQTATELSRQAGDLRELMGRFALADPGWSPLS